MRFSTFLLAFVVAMTAVIGCAGGPKATITDSQLEALEAGTLQLTPVPSAEEKAEVAAKKMAETLMDLPYQSYADAEGGNFAVLGFGEGSTLAAAKEDAEIRAYDKLVHAINSSGIIGAMTLAAQAEVKYSDHTGGRKEGDNYIARVMLFLNLEDEETTPAPAPAPQVEEATPIANPHEELALRLLNSEEKVVEIDGVIYAIGEDTARDERFAYNMAENDARSRIGLHLSGGDVFSGTFRLTRIVWREAWRNRQTGVFRAAILMSMSR